MAIASLRHAHSDGPVKSNSALFKRAVRAVVFGALASAFCFFSVGITDAHAQAGQPAVKCRTAADDAELAKLVKELDSLKGHKWRLEALKAEAQKRLEGDKQDKEYLPWPRKQEDIAQADARIEQTTKDIAMLDAALKENAARMSEVEAKIAALKALPPCQGPSAGPGPVPPPAAIPPCRTAEVDAQIAALKAKKELYERELRLLGRTIKTLGKRVSPLRDPRNYRPEEENGLRALDRQLTEYERQRTILEAEIAALDAQIRALAALKPCPEEHWTTPQPPGVEKPVVGGGKTTPPKHPKKPVKHGKRAVTEDNPLYEEHYTPPPSTKTRTHKKSGDDTSGPSRDDADRQTDEPSNDNANQPEIPIPH
ncbi:MAG: hypothetical protein HY243_15800 [Proteobacteria bacterium]|nr:hypothetical protein [Pseudomonadota bacterium]